MSWDIDGIRYRPNSYLLSKGLYSSRAILLKYVARFLNVGAILLFELYALAVRPSREKENHIGSIKHCHTDAHIISGFHALGQNCGVENDVAAVFKDFLRMGKLFTVSRIAGDFTGYVSYWFHTLSISARRLSFM